VTAHVPAEALAAYARGELDLADPLTWPVEVHLEACAECREQLAGSAPAPLLAMLADTGTTILARAAAGRRGAAACWRSSCRRRSPPTRSAPR